MARILNSSQEINYTLYTVPISEEVKAYRQALRDVPQQEGYPLYVTWPVDPNNSLVVPE